MIEAVVMQCNYCKKPAAFEIEYGWDTPVGIIIAECQKCFRKGARSDEGIMDKQVIRCECGVWKMEGSSCSICVKINALNA